jgi:hypothetical protein
MHTRNRLTHEEVTRILGDVDDIVAAEIISSGATADELREVAERVDWDDDDEERERG